MSRVALRHALNLARPALQSILPKKKTLNRILFDNDSRLPYRKLMPILTSVYDHIDVPHKITLPSYTTHNDLMLLRSVLHDLRTMSNSVNKNLVDLENELVEQAAELGDSDAIAILAFEAISSPSTSKDDYDYANKLIAELTEKKHPLVFKKAGELAFSKAYYEQAAQYWHQFLELEDNSVMASHVYSSLGIYYYQYLSPRPDLNRAKIYFEKSIAYGHLDSHTIKAHYYLGQLYSITDPILARFHLQICASKGLQESFPALGFMELNVFADIAKALEWFRLGVEANNDISCLVGQFDANVQAGHLRNALHILDNLRGLQVKLEKIIGGGILKVPESYKALALNNQRLLSTFFATRSNAILNLQS